MTPEQIEARRRALQIEEEGLAYLVPVDRIIATIAGLAGGLIVTAAFFLRIPRRLRPH